MKAKSLLLFGLAGGLLSGCTVIRTHENKVDQKTFEKKLRSALQNSILGDITNRRENKLCSFQFNTEASSLAKTTYLKDGKTLSSEKTTTETSSKLRFDYKNFIASIQGSSVTETDSGSEEKDDEYEGDMFYQCNGNKFLEIDKNAKTYVVAGENKESSAAPIGLLWNEIARKIESLLYVIDNLIDGMPSATYFIDGEIYTCEVNTNENDTETKTKRTGKDVYQIILKESGTVEFRVKCNMLVEKENYRFQTKDEGKFIISKKDINLRKLDLAKYLDITEDEEDYESDEEDNLNPQDENKKPCEYLNFLI